jgi:hypothetical protein
MNREARIVERIVAANGMPTMERRHYIPSGIETELIDPEGTDLEIRVYEQGGKIFGIAWAGKANKPLWHYRFPTRDRLDAAISRAITDRKSRQDMMQKRQDERQQFKHGLEVGAILYSSWGYDQTNISWYQVIEVKDSSVILREIAGKAAGEDKVMPDIGHFIDGPKLKRVGPGNVIRMTSYSRASVWDGKPKYETPIGMGH